MFALNCKLQFHTPEGYFIGANDRIRRESFYYDPRSIIEKYIGYQSFQLDCNSIYIVVGLNRIGKSSFLKRYFKSSQIQQDLKPHDKNEPIIVDRENISYF